ncbi:MAG: hypothetical protein ABIL16_04770 [candidate division WOR-3 bacterium]
MKMLGQYPEGKREKIKRILAYIEKENYKGYDPYDGLLSPFSRLSIPLYRLLFQQFVKRLGLWTRKVLFIPKGHNPKALALFLWSYAFLRDEGKAKNIWELLKVYSIKTNNGIAFGYNFPWQSSVFFVPYGTPNIIATSFVVFALNYAKRVFKWDVDLRVFLPFYEKTLNIFRDENGFLWISYTPYDRLRIFNSSVLGALAYMMCGGDGKFAKEIAKTLQNYQREDGSWIYGLDRMTMKYVDNIHTAYNLWGLVGIRNMLKIDDFDGVILKGYEFYKYNLFDRWGFPISKLGKKGFDTHDLAASIITFKIFEDMDRARKLEGWAVERLVDKDGRVYNGLKDKRVFIRWSVAWLLLSLVFEPYYPFRFC